MQQICRGTPMPKCDFNKFPLQLYWNHALAWVFYCKFTIYFENIFSLEHLWRTASEITCNVTCVAQILELIAQWIKLKIPDVDGSKIKIFQKYQVKDANKKNFRMFFGLFCSLPFSQPTKLCLFKDLMRINMR